MLELICQHAYTWDGVPADQSPYRNHGTAVNTGGSFDGSAPGSGVITFPRADSRVRIPLGPAWQQLIALKIDVVVRVNPHAARMPVLVAGQGSFSFGLLEGALAAEFTNPSGTSTTVRSADAFAPDSRRHTVPANRWVKLGFHHDGFARMRLFIDDDLVGEAIVNGSIPPVRGAGVAIGNAVDRDGLQFPGQIDDVKIWRLDPNAVKREFLGRPFTQRAARCWESHARTVLDWMDEHPEQRRAIWREFRTFNDAALRTLYLLPEGDQAKFRAILDEFLQLWFTGEVTGRKMEQVLRKWIAFLRAHRIDPGDGPSSRGLVQLLAGVRIARPNLHRCDPVFAVFLQLAEQALRRRGRARRVEP